MDFSSDYLMIFEILLDSLVIFFIFLGELSISLLTTRILVVNTSNPVLIYWCELTQASLTTIPLLTISFANLFSIPETTFWTFF